MNMLRYAAIAAIAGVMSGTMTSCDDTKDIEDAHVYYRVIDFENSSLVLAGPTSYGANLYCDYDGVKFTQGSCEVESGVTLDFGINESSFYGQPDFSAGGMVVSNWTYRTDAEGESAGWWKTFNNQCSVYNVKCTSGANKGGGVNGSDNFAIIFGYDSDYAQGAEFSFSGSKEYVIDRMEICPTAYVYGVITEGNPFGNAPGVSLEDQQGWFAVYAYGYDAQGNPTNSGKPVMKYICNYTNGFSPVEIANTWIGWDLSALGKVNKVKFDFDGSDKGAWGLNTPAYLCVDDIQLRLN